MTDNRPPPQNLDAEAAVLSTLLLDSTLEALDTASEIVQPVHFYSRANATIYEAALDIASGGKIPDVVTVATWLQERNRFSTIGGSEYLGQIVDSTPSVPGIGNLSKLILDKWRLRELVRCSKQITSEAMSQPVDVDEFAQLAEARVFAATQEQTAARTAQPAREIMRECVNTIAEKQSGKRPRGISWGFAALNRRVGGLVPGEVYVIAGRPGMGKSAAMTQIAHAVSSNPDEDRCGVVVFSLEMSREQIGNRLISQQCLLDTRKVNDGLLTPPELSKVTAKSQEIADLPLVVDDRANITASQMRSSLRRVRRELQRDFGGIGLGLVVVDYLQQMGRWDLPASSRNGDNAELEEILRRLKAIAKEFSVPVLVLSQLNRQCEGRTDKRPNLGDLRSSGAIEQDAYAVVFIYRRDRYVKKAEDRDGKAELLCPKVRNGREGTIRMRFLAQSAAFEPDEDDDGADEWEETPTAHPGEGYE